MIRFPTRMAGRKIGTGHKAADVTMVSASSAQREPSMEEILASIRRIIEDNETGRKPSDPDPERPAENTVIEVDAFRADLRAPSGEAKGSPRPAAAERNPVLLPEARPEASADAGTASLRWTPQPRFTDASHAWAGDAPLSRADETRPVPESPPVAEAAPGAALVSEPEGGTEAESAPLPSLVTDAGASAAAEASLARSAILSEHAGRKVAAAFGELSEAFAARSRKTFDDLAAEMLRPMLQDWLDDNLPGLVERLVREEIERVARGV